MVPLLKFHTYMHVEELLLPSIGATCWSTLLIKIHIPLLLSSNHTNTSLLFTQSFHQDPSAFYFCWAPHKRSYVPAVVLVKLWSTGSYGTRSPATTHLAVSGSRERTWALNAPEGFWALAFNTQNSHTFTNSFIID